MDIRRETLKSIILKHSYQKRRIRLSSGRESDFYFDGKQTTLHPEGAALVGQLLWEKIRDHFPQAEAVGGPTLGADPIITSVGLAGYSRGFPHKMFIVRKEAKGHGTQSWIEGASHLRPGMRVVLVEDVITTGGSLLRAAHRVQAAGLVVVGYAVLVDREEGGKENLESEGVQVVSLFRKSELIV